MASNFSTKIPSLSAIFSVYTSLSAFTILFKTILHEIIPVKIRDFLISKFTDYFSSYFNFNFTFIIEEQSDYVMNQTFRAAQVYLPTLLSRISTRSLLVSSSDLKNPLAKPKFGIPVKAKIIDDFKGIRLEWTLLSAKDNDNPYQSKRKRYFHLTCKNEFRDKIMSDYFTYIAKSSVKILTHKENLNIYNYNPDCQRWESAIFQHHTTFETLAMEPELKNTLIRDLETRIYDLQIQSVKDDAMLRQILTLTENRSILLIEDLDCSGADATCRYENKDETEHSEKQNNKKNDPKVTLSGLLNFVDGLWSSCVEERIIVFTTNHKEKLDPALLRPGRMDMLLEVKTTPAEITEQLMVSKNPDATLKGLVEFLESKKMTKESVDTETKEAEA
ncbi:unnamed protein product [Arabidopsis arenosa]|uniref:ATPase AAA-type core domain-containing protein n=1 Tax=Arabidopsis arenosa TaxID=38785 RepID=A0A8S2APG3_ARAAE|nr:unnamed protein product [Arabidopsis arenosa]